MRLDKYISQELRCGSKAARLLIVSGKVCVNGCVCRDNVTDVTIFCRVECNGEVLNEYEAYYLMMNKPKGYVSATVDVENETIIDLVQEPYAELLHLAGRLDKQSTGLLLMTNDGGWSRRVTEPVMAIPKRYLVSTECVIAEGVISCFAEGIYFAFEDLTTLPAELEILTPKTAIITIYEGRYHQVKRMFHAVGNRVMSLSIGELELDPSLALGEYRALTPEEIGLFSPLDL